MYFHNANNTAGSTCTTSSSANAVKMTSKLDNEKMILDSLNLTETCQLLEDFIDENFRDIVGNQCNLKDADGNYDLSKIRDMQNMYGSNQTRQSMVQMEDIYANEVQNKLQQNHIQIKKDPGLNNLPLSQQMSWSESHKSSGSGGNNDISMAPWGNKGHNIMESCASNQMVLPTEPQCFKIPEPIKANMPASATAQNENNYSMNLSQDQHKNATRDSVTNSEQTIQDQGKQQDSKKLNLLELAFKEAQAECQYDSEKTVTKSLQSDVPMKDQEGERYEKVRLGFQSHKLYQRSHSHDQLTKSTGHFSQFQKKDSLSKMLHPLKSVNKQADQQYRGNSMEPFQVTRSHSFGESFDQRYQGTKYSDGLSDHPYELYPGQDLVSKKAARKEPRKHHQVPDLTPHTVYDPQNMDHFSAAYIDPIGPQPPTGVQQVIPQVAMDNVGMSSSVLEFTELQPVDVMPCSDHREDMGIPLPASLKRPITEAGGNSMQGSMTSSNIRSGTGNGKASSLKYTTLKVSNHFLCSSSRSGRFD